MVRSVSGSAHFAEELGNVPREDSLILQSPKEIVLRLLARHIDPNLRRDQLSKQLSELPQLQQAGIRIIREIALREHPQAHELLVVGLEIREVCPKLRQERIRS